MNPPTGAPARPKQGSQVPQAEGWFAQPQRIERSRTAGDVVKGLGAALVLVILLGVIPFALVRYIGWPLPHHMPSSHFFDQKITPQVLLDALAVIVWLAWAQFVACVVVEFRAAVRGIGMPTRVPAAGPSQFLARQLVATLLMITASAASFVPNLSHLGAGSNSVPPTAMGSPAATAGMLSGADQNAAIGRHPAGAVSVHNLPAVRGESGLRVASNSAVALRSDSTKLYRVQPPHGRHHDTLWEIAQRHLGDGRRYKEIFELNKDRVQPDGSKLTHASLIRPGWILTMPPDATGGDLVIETAPTSPQNLSPAQSGGIQPGGAQPGGALPGAAQPGTSQPGTAPSITAQPSVAPTTPSAAPSISAQPSVAPSTTAQPSSSAPSTPSAAPSTPSPTQTAPTQPAPTQTAPTQTAPTQTVSTAPSAAQISPSALTPVPSTAPPTIQQTPVEVDAPGTTTQNPDTSAQNTATGDGTETAQTPTVVQPAEDLAKAAAAAVAAATGPENLTAVPHATVPHGTAARTSVPGAAVPGPSIAHATIVHLPATKPATPATLPPPQSAPPTQTPESPALAPESPHSPQSANSLELSASPESPASPASVDAPVPTPASPASLEPPAPAAISPAQLDSQSSPEPRTQAAALAPLTPRPLAPSHRGTHAPEESQPPSTEDRVLFGLAASPLLAAGLLKAIGRHRRRQLWNRVFGRRPVTPTGDGAVAEESIRVGASEVEVWFLDLALRGLSAGLADRGQTVPGAYAVRLRDEGIELLLNKPIAPDDPAVQPPAPWFTAADGRSWNFPRPGIVDVDAQAAHRRFAPYPGLVTIGAHGSDRLMIDLEEARGLIGLDGPSEICRAVLAALAVELATNSWSDRMTVTLVGFPGDLTPLAPARVRHVRTLDEILPSLEIEAGERAKALAAAGLESVLDGRSRAGQASSFPPHFVLISEEPHAAILARLATIATTSARVGLGFVIAGNLHGATWQLTVSSERRITAPALGIEARAQLLPEEQYAAVLGLFRAVCDIEGTDVAARAAQQSVGYGGALPDEPPSVYASLLGPLEVTGVGTTEPERVALLNEALVFLLHHRDGVHPRVLATALWPRGTTAEVAEATFASLTTWLGTDPHGKPNLHTDAEGRLRLGPYVWSDWDVFIARQSRALYDATIPDQKQRDEMLKSALDLVRGPYLADREPNRYGWLAYEIAEAQVPAVIGDTSLRLTDSYIASGEAEAAIEAVKAGMRGSPDDEELWRGLLRATAATHDTERLRGAIEGLYKRTWYVHGVQGLHPRTEALVNELMPDWREAIVA